MSLEQLKAFLEKVKADNSLQEKLKAVAAVDAALAIAKEAGFAITAEDIQSAPWMEMPDDELENAVGGRGCNQLASRATERLDTNWYAGCFRW